MNWKKAVSVMLVGIMALSMTACGDSGETSTDAASGGGSTAESTEGAGTSASGDDKLVVWTLSNDLIDFGERFEEQTGVAVDTVVIEPANYPTKVQTALLGGVTTFGGACNEQEVRGAFHCVRPVAHQSIRC